MLHFFIFLFYILYFLYRPWGIYNRADIFVISRCKEYIQIYCLVRDVRIAVLRPKNYMIKYKIN